MDQAVEQKTEQQGQSQQRRSKTGKGVVRKKVNTEGERQEATDLPMQLLSTQPTQPCLSKGPKRLDDSKPTSSAAASSASSSSAQMRPTPGPPGQFGPQITSSVCQPLANRRLWQQMACGREELSNGGPRGAPVTVWESIVGSKFQHDENSDKKNGYALPNQTGGKECSLTNCEATSECSTVDTTTSWPVFSIEDELLAERIAAVLMDREVAETCSPRIPRVLYSHLRHKPMELRH